MALGMFLASFFRLSLRCYYGTATCRGKRCSFVATTTHPALKLGALPSSRGDEFALRATCVISSTIFTTTTATTYHGKRRIFIIIPYSISTVSPTFPLVLLADSLDSIFGCSAVETCYPSSRGTRGRIDAQILCPGRRPVKNEESLRSPKVVEVGTPSAVSTVVVVVVEDGTYTRSVQSTDTSALFLATAVLSTNCTRTG